MTLARLLDARRGPDQIVLVRPDQIRANVADATARERGEERLRLDARDADGELTDEDRRQADALRARLSSAEASLRPTTVLSSPSRRDAATAEHPDGARHLSGRCVLTAGDRLAVATGPVGYLARELPPQLSGLLAELSAHR